MSKRFSVIVERICLFLGLILLSALPVFGQQGIDLGDNFNRGRNKIEGKIYYPSGRPADKRFKVSLQSVGVSDMFTLSDDQGAFIFRQLPGGTYRITIDAGKEYETFFETVNVIDPPRRQGDNSERTIAITVFLKTKEAATAPTDTVNAALANVPKPALELYEKAQQAVKENDTQKAILLLEESVKKYPQFAEGYNELGILYMRSNKLDKAAEAFREAIKIAPDKFSYRLNCGYAYLLNNKAGAAKTELTKAVEINNKSIQALILLGRAQLKSKDYSDAEKTFFQAVGLGGADVNMAYRFLGVLYNEKNEIEKTVSAFEKYLSMTQEAKDGEVFVKLGRAQIKLQRYADAEKSLQKAVSLSGPETGIAYKFLGALYNEVGEAARAVEALEKYLSLTPNAKDADQVRKIIEDLRRQKN